MEKGHRFFEEAVMFDGRKNCRKYLGETCICDNCQKVHKQKLAWLLGIHRDRKRLKLVKK